MKKILIVLSFAMLGFLAFANTSADENLYGIGASFARLAEVEGSVNVYRDSYQLEKADTNLPLNPLDVLKTSPDSRAVIQFIDGTLLKVGEDTKVEFLEIDGSKQSFAMIVRLYGGKIYYDVSDSDDFGSRTFRIDTEDATVFILQHGQYRIDKNGFETDVKVVSGKAEIDVSQGAKIVRSGEAAIVNSNGAVQTFVFNTFDRDEFDLWAANSYKRKVVVSEKYVPRKIRHYVYELDSYGTWVYDDSVEVYVWRPYIVETDWVPYSYGRWVWSPFGMTWVSYYPWGYAPFHYGYWNFSVSFGWVWVPDVWYSPAWVTWNYWDNYVGWYPCRYYRGRVIRYPIRYRRRVVYAPVDRFYRRGIRYRTAPIPANRRVVTVRNPILPDPAVLRKNPREAVVRAIRKPVTRQVIERNITRMRKKTVRNGERITTIGRVRDRSVISPRDGRRNSRSIERRRDVVKPRVIERGSSRAGSRVIRDRTPVIRNERRIERRNSERKISPNNSGRSIERKNRSGDVPVIRNGRTIERNSQRRTPTYRQNRSIERNSGRSVPVYRQNRRIERNSETPVYRQRRENQRYSPVPKTNRRTIVPRGNSNSSGTRSHSYSYSNSGRTHSYSGSSGSHSSSRSIRITPKSYSSPRSSGSSRRSIRRRR